ncbi:MAG: uroporphyrinogen decarboxylase family protein [Christensenella sp.]
MGETSRERLTKTLAHEEPDKVVVDLGSSLVTGISAVALSKLRDALGLEKRLVKVYEPMQLLGLVEEDVIEALGIDVVGISTPYTNYGYQNDAWKQWKIHDTDVLVGEGFTTTIDEEGNTYVYPQGDTSVAPSAKMPAAGYYFDNIVRQGDMEHEDLNGREDFKNDFACMSDAVVDSIKTKVTHYYNDTSLGINMGNFLCGFGDAAALPGSGQKKTNGIRSVEEWLVAHYTEPEYVHDVYSYQLEEAIKTLEKLKNAVGDMPQVVQISGTDFGTQRSEFISPDMYREFYKPYHMRINKWVHENTNWKVMYHTCGSIVNLLDDLAEVNVDILNPVQCSAEGMEPHMLKEKYGDKFVFWGGGVDTQKTLAFGTPEDVYEEVTERLKIFAPGGGFVFNTVHNIQAPTPTQNILAMFDAIKDYNK